MGGHDERRLARVRKRGGGLRRRRVKYLCALLSLSASAQGGERAVFVTSECDDNISNHHRLQAAVFALLFTRR